MNEDRPIPFNSASRDEEPVPEEYGEGPLESLFEPGITRVPESLSEPVETERTNRPEGAITDE